MMRARALSANQTIGRPSFPPTHASTRSRMFAAAFMTAFYSWRLLFMTFHGEGRMDAETKAQLRESPWVVTLPLILLAAPKAQSWSTKDLRPIRSIRQDDVIGAGRRLGDERHHVVAAGIVLGLELDVVGRLEGADHALYRLGKQQAHGLLQAAEPRLRKHRGPALVFRDYNHMAKEIEREDLDADLFAELKFRGIVA